ncbi:hypothetical protein FA10DRAFT_268075 [Acaromyces ingoldii]|uniref:RRM domain-containing protein n=1 Tax=Acaromyces ingoldii TaxID=215250 RepID=A0A316YL47_9BASI|nr:hypothetical protein FA10DRAFT_268075 [Acaromyces ingoldii]PWN89534.1 hypothetical protein FA10DRAFT_268075 [Acaromyces ingoldii]
MAASAPKVRRRMHISGLNPLQCSTSDISARMASFGLEATSIEGWPPGQDGVGRTVNWCFATLVGPEEGVKRAINTLSGTTWKGHKLRLGLARERAWGSRNEEEDGEGSKKGTRDKADKEREEKEAKKEKKKKERIRKAGFESRDLSEAVTSEKVDKGEWGWKKTPAGHLIRPMHMRPERPVPVPAVPAASTKEDDKRKRRGKGKGSGEPAKRARRRTIDPTRYAAVHFSGSLLDDGTAAVEGEWTFEGEGDESGAEKWILKSRDGKILREEVAVRKTHTLPSAEAESDHGGASELESEATASSSSQSDSSVESETPTNQQNKREAEKDAAYLKVDSYPAYDPDEEDAFSEGYQEAIEGVDLAPGPGEDERSRYLTLLQDMFGGVKGSIDADEANRLRQAQEEKNNLFEDSDNDTDSDDEDDDGDDDEYDGDDNEGDAKQLEQSNNDVQQADDNETGDDEGQGQIEQDEVMKAMDPQPNEEVKSKEEKAAAEAEQKRIERRAAFLAVPAPDSEHREQADAFTPHVRFDPGFVEEDEEEEDVVEQGQADLSPNDEAKTQEQQSQAKDGPAEPNRVSMSSLKDMFRPQEETGGFSIMGNLDLDLDEELNFEPDEDQPVFPASDDAGTESAPGMSGTAVVKQPKGLDFDPNTPFFFPTVARSSSQSSSRPDVFDVLRTTTTSSVQPFRRTATEDEIRSRWQEARGQLTSDYRKRHKDAVRKKKRSRLATA